MKRIVLNRDNLDEIDIRVRKKKVRALIVDDNNMVTLCNYANVWMLPGGKVEDGEDSILALFRELEEELGIDFSGVKLEELVTIANIAHDYPVRNSSKKENRMCETDYFVIRSNKRIDKSKIKLTDSEKKHNFRIEYVPIDRILEVVENSEYRSFRNKYFVRELLTVLDEYFKGELFKESCCFKDSLIDLHIHTTASDGEKSPNEIIEEAIKCGAQAISFADHDTILGYRNLVYDRDKIKIIAGIELSAYSEIGRLHILGYGFDLNNNALNDKMSEFHQNSINSVLMLVDVLKRNFGIEFNYDDIDKLVRLERNIGRPDLAKLMLQYGIVCSIEEAFDRYLIEAYDRIKNIVKKPSYQECFELIKGAGGVPGLAHPHSLLLDDRSLYETILEMKRYGLESIEAYHSNTPFELSNKLVSMALEQNLYITGGSDYHGCISKPDISLFTGRNNNIKMKRLNLVRDINGI